MKKLLIISNTFFPDPVVAAIRMTEWCRHLPETGWCPTVVCRHFGFDCTDQQLAEAISPDVSVNYVGPRRPKPSANKGPGTNRRFSRRIVENVLASFLVPDVMIIKQRQIFRETLEIARRVDPDIVLSTSPHHSVHWLGRKVSQSLAKPWVADFRDPYIIDSRCQPSGLGRLSWFRHKAFERSIYEQADLCLHAIPFQFRWAKQTYKTHRKKIRLLTNGIPAGLVDDGTTVPFENREKTTILVPLEIDSTILEYFAEFAATNNQKHISFVVCSASPENVDALQQTSGNAFEFCGRLPHQEYIARLKRADVLIGYLSSWRARSLLLSSKLFEFLALGKPVININSTRSDRLFLHNMPWCQLLEQPDKNRIIDALHRAVFDPVLPSPEWLARFRSDYSRRNQTKTLGAWLDALTITEAKHTGQAGRSS